MPEPIRVTVWNEGRHEQRDEAVRAVYPTGIHTAIAEHLVARPGILVRTATLDDPQHGLSQQTLDETDVLIWWGHMAHRLVDEENVTRVQHRVLQGMGFLPLHSAHMSKVFASWAQAVRCAGAKRESGKYSGSSPRVTPLSRELAHASFSIRPRCTASPSMCPPPTSWS